LQGRNGPGRPLRPVNPRDCGRIIPSLCRNVQQVFAPQNRIPVNGLWICCGKPRLDIDDPPSGYLLLRCLGWWQELPRVRDGRGLSLQVPLKESTAETGRGGSRIYSRRQLVIRRREAHYFNSLLSNFMSLWSLNQRQGK
jgi:hypothetical protein